jgi:hypothetical protein
VCLSCGCGSPNDSHGDPAHITLDVLERAATAAGISSDDAVRNIQHGIGASDQGASIAGDGSTHGRDAVDDEPVVTEAHGSVM